MDQDFASPDHIDGCPSFVRRDGTDLNWWSPTRTGNDAADFAAGQNNFYAALSLLHSGNFYTALGSPIVFNPYSVLPDIVAGMRVSGAIERGFLDALTRKAAVGCAPPLALPHPGITEHDRLGEEHAHFCLLAARNSNWPELMFEELVAALDYTFDCGNPRAFVWTVCLAAASGGLH